MSEQSGTWHYGLMARWWAEFNVAEPQELAYYRTAIRRFGEPVLDLGCGTGRFLIPLRAEGFDVDGADVSEDMLAQARRRPKRSCRRCTTPASMMSWSRATHRRDGTSGRDDGHPGGEGGAS